jgi:hypothetical protein
MAADQESHSLRQISSECAQSRGDFCRPLLHATQPHRMEPSFSRQCDDLWDRGIDTEH